MLRILFKRGTAALNSTLTEALGSITVDTDVYGLRVHDGVTEGGHPLVIASNVESLQQQIDSLGIEGVDGLSAALAAKVASDELGAADGVASLNPQGVVPTEQLPSYVEDIIGVADAGSLPATGEIGKLYLTSDTNELFRWSGGQQTYYQIGVTLSSSDDLSEGQVNLYFTQQRVRDSFNAGGDVTYNPATGEFGLSESVTSVDGKTGAVTVDRSDVGLSLVENYPMADQASAQAATTDTEYMNPYGQRVLFESMGFEEYGGVWSADPGILPAVGVTEVFTQLDDYPGDTSYDNGGVIFGDAAYILSSGDFYKYDFGTGGWVQLTSIPPSHNRSDAAVGVHDGLIYSFTYQDDDETRVASYDPQTDTWDTNHASITGTDYGQEDADVAIIDGVAYLTGGLELNDKVLAYDLTTEQVTEKAAPVERKRWQGTAHLGTDIYVLAGDDADRHLSDHINTDSMWKYDTVADEWTEVASLPGGARRYIDFTAIGGKLYVFGGYADSGGAGNLSDLWEYDPTLDQWVEITGHGIGARRRHVFVGDETRGLIVGGWGTATTWLLGG